MQPLIKTLQSRYPNFHYIESDAFYWSPRTKEIFYTTTKDPETQIWSLLHETGHALLEHSSYKTDFELVSLEVAAWQRAKLLGQELSLPVDDDHIQDCLDTYRDWLYARSVCPTCGNKCLQQDDLIHYRCFNCRSIWSVTPSRFCRAYRSTKHQKKPSVPVFRATDGFAASITFS
jgi:hypothetical protein